MNWVRVIQSILLRFDSRSSAQVDADLEDEFEFHIQQSTKELVEEGDSVETGRLEARSRFGDMKQIKSQCKHIALQERIMLQKINLALMVAVLLAVAFVSVQMYTTQKYNTLALQAIVDDIAVIKAQEQQTLASAYQQKLDRIIQDNPPAENMYAMFGQVMNSASKQIVEKLELETEDAKVLKDIFNDMNMRMQAGKKSPFRVGFVYLGGDVVRPGAYGLPQVGKLTVSRLLASSGGLTGEDLRVKVARSVTGEEIIVFDQIIKDLSDIGKADIVLITDDLITVGEVAGKVGQNLSNKERVTIGGAVHAAGIYTIPTGGKFTLADLLTKARGPSERAVQVNLYRMVDGKRQVIVQETISLASEIGRLTQPLAPNDRIEVKPVLAYTAEVNGISMGKVYIDGPIATAGAYDLKAGGNMTISKLFAAAGGLTELPVVVKVKRLDVNGGHNYVVNQSINSVSDLAKNDILLKPDDMILISPVDNL